MPFYYSPCDFFCKIFILAKYISQNIERKHIDTQNYTQHKITTKNLKNNAKNFIFFATKPAQNTYLPKFLTTTNTIVAKYLYLCISFTHNTRLWKQ